jgi:hypothetical protein
MNPRIDELQRIHRPDLFFDCEICEQRVRIQGHEHDVAKTEAWLAKQYPPIATIEERLSSVLEKYVGQTMNECRHRLISDLVTEFESISRPTG